MVSFPLLPAVKKDTIFGAAQTKLSLSYFVRALEQQNKAFESEKSHIKFSLVSAFEKMHTSLEKIK